MMTMLILSIVMAVAYVAAVIIRDKTLPDSVSALVYALPKGRWRWLWSAWLALVTLLMATALTAAMSATWWMSLLADATIICLAMTAALPLLPGYHNRLHNALGILSGVLSQVCVWFICPWYLMLWLLFVMLLVLHAFPDVSWAAKVADKTSGKGVFLLEAVCSAALYAAMITAILSLQ